MRLIDKDDLVAEIRKRLLPVIRDKHYDEWEEGQNSERIAILDIINTLEVKEVNLEKEIKKYIEDNICGYCVPGVEETAKYFFELGMSVSNKVQKDLELTWEDIKNLENLCMQKRVNDGLFDKEDYEEVLKLFKVQKGEL